MEIEMTRFYTGEPYTFSNSRECGSYVHEIENLDLSARGFPGFSFTGELGIEPDDSMENEDWYIEGAYATNPDGKTYTKYDHKNQPALFKAICEAVVNDSRLFDIITETSREHAE